MKVIDPWDLGFRSAFWDQAAHGDNENFQVPIKFSDPVNVAELSKHVDTNASLLDFGCGYGRVSNIFYQAGYRNIRGIDISSAMIKRAQCTFPRLKNNLQTYNGKHIPFPDNHFEAITCFTMLNAIPCEMELSNLFNEFKRVLKANGIIYLYEFMIAPFDRDIKRYEQFKAENPDLPYGTFQHSSGSIMRHFSNKNIAALLNDVDILWHNSFEFVSMNNNPCIHDEWIARLVMT